MEEKKIEKLYELLENKDLDNETSAALKWAIFELESIYRKEELRCLNEGKTKMNKQELLCDIIQILTNLRDTASYD